MINIDKHNLLLLDNKMILSFLNFIHLYEARAIDSSLPVRVDPKGSRLDSKQEPQYVVGRGGSAGRGSRRIGAKDRVLGRKFSGTMTTTDHMAALRYTFPRDTHIIHHVDPDTNQHHFSITANSNQDKENIKSYESTIRTTPPRIQKKVPQGLPGERVTSTRSFNRANKLSQDVSDPVEFAKKRGVKVTFRTSKEQEEHAKNLQQKKVKYTEEG